jgi:hypothetical protein
MAHYLNRLKKRMLSTGFQRDDPRYDAVLNAERATHAVGSDGAVGQSRDSDS